MEFPVVMVATDRRLVFVPADAGRSGETGRVRYADLRAVEVGETVTLCSLDGDGWKLPVEPPGPVARHLRWVGELRARAIRLGEETAEAAERVRELAAEGAWADAEGTYEAHRDRLDGLFDAAHRSAPAVDSLIPELTAVERRLERAAAWLWLTRAEAELDGGHQTESDEAARESFDRARSRIWATRRGDGFRFGEQRELTEALAALRGRLEGDESPSGPGQSGTPRDGERAGAAGQ